jgi:hypothetical protein
MNEAEVLRRIFVAYNDDDLDGVVADATDDVTYVFGPHDGFLHSKISLE